MGSTTEPAIAAGKHPVMLADFAVLGGMARAAKLTPSRRSAIARRAARARWRKHRKWPFVTAESQCWQTPRSLFDGLNAQYGPFDLDVAASAENTLCSKYFDEATDGLKQVWAPARCWMNPPYDPRVLPLWMEKAYRESQCGALVVCLVPSRTDLPWWASLRDEG
jgi:DNA N-6-adenine-methyltransferase Dam